MELGPVRVFLIVGSKAGGSLLFDFKDDGSLNELRDRAVVQFMSQRPDCNFGDAGLYMRGLPTLADNTAIFATMRERKKAGKPIELNLTINETDEHCVGEDLPNQVREVSQSISVHNTANVDQLNAMLANNEELIAAWQSYDASVAVMEEALTKVKSAMNNFARMHALLTPQLVKNFFEVLRRFPTRDTGKPFVAALQKTAEGVEPIRKEHKEYQAALATVDTANKKLALIQKDNVKGKVSNERQMVKLTEALRECERANTAVNIPKLKYQSKLQDLQFSRALALLELMASNLSARAKEHSACKTLMDSAGKEGQELFTMSKKRQEEFSATKERNSEKIQQSMLFQSMRGAEIMNAGVFQAHMMLVVVPTLPATLTAEVIKKRLAQVIFLDADRFVPGELIVTRYRLAFAAYIFSKTETVKVKKADEQKNKAEDEVKAEMEMIFSVPLVSLLRIDELENKTYIFTCKDLSTLSISLVHCIKPDGPPLIGGENKSEQYSVCNSALWAEVRSFAFDHPFYAFEFCTKFRSTLAASPASPSSVQRTDNNEDGWGVYAPMAEWGRLNVPNKFFRISQINNDYTFAPTYPRWLVFPAEADDNFMGAAGPFRSKNRCPTLHWCMRRRGQEGPPYVGIYGCSQPKVGFQQHRNVWDENLLDFCSGAEKGSNPLPDKPSELKQLVGATSTASMSPAASSSSPPYTASGSGTIKRPTHQKTSSLATKTTTTESRLFPFLSASSPRPKAHTTKPPSHFVDVETRHQYLKLQSSSVTSPYHRVILLEKPNTTYPYYDVAADDDLEELKRVWEQLHDLPHPESLKDMKPEARLNFVMEFLQKSSQHHERGSVSQSHAPSSTRGGGDDDYFDEDEETFESMDADERAAYEHIKKLNEQPLDKAHTRPAVIVDCRPYVNALANVAKGYGWENISLYKRCSIKFLGVPNIHVMRESLSQLRSLFLSMLKSDSASAAKDAHFEDDPYKHITLELRNNSQGCKWFQWLSLILEGAVGCARHLLDGKPVIVHCSDGWDRTPQVIALTLLMLDPFFRTIRGLAVLIEKEFLSYGHKFADRMGHETERANPKVKERSPVFLQWLDCVYQLVHQFPTQFEYDGRLLARLADHIFSCKYGTFFANTEKERIDDQITTRTVSVWTPILGNARLFRSPHYEKTEHSRENSANGSFQKAEEDGGINLHEDDILLPKYGVADMVLFTEFYQRWDPRKTAACSLLTIYENTLPIHSSSSTPMSAVPQPPSTPTRSLPSALLRSIAHPPHRDNVRPGLERPATTPTDWESSSAPRTRSGPLSGSSAAPPVVPPSPSATSPSPTPVGPAPPQRVPMPPSRPHPGRIPDTLKPIVVPPPRDSAAALKPARPPKSPKDASNDGSV